MSDPIPDTAADAEQDLTEPMQERRRSQWCSRVELTLLVFVAFLIAGWLWATSRCTSCHSGRTSSRDPMHKDV